MLVKLLIRKRKKPLRGQILDQNQCWTTPKYTKPLQFKTTLAFKDLDRNVATSIKTKEAFICRLLFPKPPISFGPKPLVLPAIAHIGVTKIKIAYVLMS